MTVCEGKKEESMGRELAEDEIFRLRKKAALLLQAGNIQEYNCILITISALQETNNAVVGIERKPNERTAS